MTEQLTDRVRAGSIRAFETLYRQHRDHAMRLALYFTRSPMVYDDLAQEAFKRILETLLQGKGPTDEKFPAYLGRTIHNIAVRHFMKQKREILENEIELAALDVDPAMIVVDRDFANGETLSITHALRSLDIRWQVILFLVDIKSMLVDEAAEFLRISPGAANALLYRARRGLRGAVVSKGVA
jgi:RNA polymerase sigma factor (sigma-70 family)